VKSVSDSPSIACARNSDPICYEEADRGGERDEEEKGDTGCLEALLDRVPSLGKMMGILVEGDHVSHQTSDRAARQSDNDDYHQDLRIHSRMLNTLTFTRALFKLFQQIQQPVNMVVHFRCKLGRKWPEASHSFCSAVAENNPEMCYRRPENPCFFAFLSLQLEYMYHLLIRFPHLSDHGQKLSTCLFRIACSDL